MDYCDHIGAVLPVTASADGCEDCLKTGDIWLHLRLCMSCGHVGCCDSSVNRHAAAHYQTSHHPIIKSHELGEEWVYCFVDESFFERLPDSGSRSAGT